MRVKCSKYVVHVPPNRGPPPAHVRVSLVSSTRAAVGAEPSQRPRSTTLSDRGPREAAHVPRVKLSDTAGDRRLSAQPGGDGLRAVFAYNPGLKPKPNSVSKPTRLAQNGSRGGGVSHT